MQKRKIVKEPYFSEIFFLFLPPVLKWESLGILKAICHSKWFLKRKPKNALAFGQELMTKYYALFSRNSF